MLDSQGRLTQRLSFVYLRWLPPAIVAYGVVVRVREYLSGRSLWLDEISITLNVLNRGYADLLRPLDYAQGAPVGWLWAQRTAATLLGDNEYALRLIPFIAGIAAMFVFWHLARKLLPDYCVPLALALFSSSSFLIYYSAEAKQYSSDVALGLVLIVLSIPLVGDNPKRRDALTWTSAGALAMWFSHPAVFVLAGAGCVALCRQALARRWRVFRAVAVSCLVCGMSFAANYLLFLRKLSATEVFRGVWARGFLPHPVTPEGTTNWLWDRWTAFLDRPAALEATALVTILTVAGVVTCLRRRWLLGALVAACTAAFLVAAVLGAYPLSDRLALVLVPLLFLVIAAGGGLLPSRAPRGLAVGLAAVLAAAVAMPLQRSLAKLRHPTTITELRPVLFSLAQERQAGDEIWMHHAAGAGLSYYGRKWGLRADVVLQFQPESKPCNDVRRLTDARGRARRIWLVFGHAFSTAPQNDAATYLSRLAPLGRRVQTLSAPGASAHLFDLSAPPADPGRRRVVARRGRECLSAHRLRSGRG